MLKKKLPVMTVMALVIAGCANLPSQGPRVADIQQEYQSAKERKFELVEVNEKTITVLKRQSSEGLYARFGDYRPSPSPTIGIGDGLAITIWETGQNSMFGGGGGKFSGIEGLKSPGNNDSSLPILTVNREGRITVPYVGQVSVVDRTPFEVQSVIQEGLAGKSVEPQVLVTIARRASSAVTIVGEVVSGARIPLDEYSYRLLDVIATTGGIKVPLHEAYVQITRSGNTEVVPFKDILENPMENIQMHPGDVVAVLRRPQTYTVFGATGRNSQITFDTPKLNLLEALAKSGGLLDPLADPKGVYLLRHEPVEVVNELVDDRQAPSRQDGVPVIYQIDMSKAGSYFTAQSLEVENRDVLYVSSASATELQKFLLLVGLISQPIITGATVTSVADN